MCNRQTMACMSMAYKSPIMDGWPSPNMTIHAIQSNSWPWHIRPTSVRGNMFHKHRNAWKFHHIPWMACMMYYIFFISFSHQRTTCMTSNTAILWSCFRHHDCVGTELEATKTYLKPKCSSLVLTNVVTGRNNRIFAGHCAQELFFQKCCQQWDQISAFFLWWVSLRESLQHITGLVGLVWLWFIPDCYIIYIYLSHP